MIYYLIAVAILLLDQLTKITVPKTTVDVIGKFVRLTYTENTGAAFGILKDHRIFLIIVGLIVTALIVYFWNKIPKNEWLIRLGLACILGGSLSNLSDRIFRGFVVDYIDFRVWPVFNLADTIINLGVLLIAIRLLSYEYLRKIKE